MSNISQDELEVVNSWAKALEGSKGYNDKSLVLNLIEQFRLNLPSRLIKNSNTNLSQRQIHLLLAFLKVCSSVEGEVVSVADIGGGNGYMHDFLRDHNLNTKINYDVYETQEIARGYKKFGKELGISFLDIEYLGLKKYDLILISGTLQYVENWREILQISSMLASNTQIMRLPLSPASKNSFYIQHNETGVYGLSHASYPFIMFSRVEFINEVEINFNISMQLIDSDENYPYLGKNYSMNTLFLNSKNFLPS
jgi:putative methyltransferase (TIGR04325 family)